jgi:general secretion pathway protein I
MGNIDNAAYLRDKTIAHWVALNQLELAYLENQHSNQLINRERSGTETLAGREWYWQMLPKETANEAFLQLQVSVRLDPDDEAALVTVAGLIDQFHAP